MEASQYQSEVVPDIVAVEPVAAPAEATVAAVVPEAIHPAVVLVVGAVGVPVEAAAAHIAVAAEPVEAVGVPLAAAVEHTVLAVGHIVVVAYTFLAEVVAQVVEPEHLGRKLFPFCFLTP